MATTSKSDWINKQRAAANAIIAACQTIKNNDNEYVANNYSAGLVNGDFVGSNAGITAAQMTTAEANLLKVADALLGTAASFPVSIISGTNTTIFAVR